MDEGFQNNSGGVMRPSKEVEAEAGAPSFTVYIGNLPISVSGTWVRDVFMRFGDIDDVFLFKKLKCPNTSCYAFVRFHVHKEAHAAI